MNFTLLDVGYLHIPINISGLPKWHSGKEPTCLCGRYKRLRFNLWVWKIPWRQNWQPTPVFLPGKLHGQRSLVGYHPWGLKRVRLNCMTEHRHTQ